MPDARYELKSFATDSARNNVAAYAVFHGTHTGQGGPVPPTGRQMSTDYVYVMQFDGDKIAHMTKIWNAGLALRNPRVGIAKLPGLRKQRVTHVVTAEQ